MTHDTLDIHVDHTYREVLQWASSFLEKAGREPQAAQWLLRERQEWNQTELVMHSRETMPQAAKERLVEDVLQHAKGTPVQHIVGREWFYGRPFTVSPDVLIPRPETEELVHHFLNEAPPEPLRVLDIGTGSGAIAITAKKERPQDDVTATDISPKALSIARRNAEQLEAEVSFKEGDLTEPVKDQRFHVVLSNPPYIAKTEVDVMDEVVLDHEPNLALFAEENGLAVYRRLAQELPSLMEDGGKIYLEIGYRQGEAVKKLFQARFPEAQIDVLQDMAGLDRIVRVKL